MTTAGVLDFPAVGFIRGDHDFTYSGDGSIGVLPAGSVVYDVMVVVTEAFNASVGNRIWIGTAASPLLFLNVSADAVLLPGAYRGIAAPGLGVAAPEGGLRVFARYYSTGDAATTGRYVAYLIYLPAMR